MGLKARPSSGMTEREFWSLIETEVRVEADGGIDGSGLAIALASLPPAQIVAFDEIMARLHADSRTWRLWGAAAVIHGGCPDDTFDYFRSWLIGRGRRVFEAALKDPDTLASVATTEALDDEVYAAAEAAYDEVTGQEIPSASRPLPPLAKEFDLGDAEELRRRYPKLCRRFAAGVES